MEIKTVGVVGGGTMGAGIIQTLSSYGFTVFFKDVDETLVKKCLDQVSRIYVSALKKGKLTEDDMKKGLSLVQGRTDYANVDGVDLVIEAVPEDLEIKKIVFTELNKVCKPGVILASNTSSFPITRLASFTEGKKRACVIGMHWFNPPHIMRLIEVIPGLETSDEAVRSVIEFSLRLGKTPVRVKECAGFLVNRLLGIYMNEALFMVEEEVRPSDIDKAALSLGMPMGPLSLGDMVGWDVIYHANRTLYEEYGSRFKLPQVLGQMVKEGRLGAKTGKGVHLYEASQGGPPRKVVVEESFPDPSKLKELSERLLLVWINEGVRCLEERVAEGKDIDQALQLGAGMPKGPLAWADDLGLDTVLDGLERWKNLFGERFWPSPLLKRKVYAGYLGKKCGKGMFFYEPTT